MKCTNCRSELTENMLSGGMCFNCGHPVAQSIEIHEQTLASEREQTKILENKLKEEQLMAIHNEQNERFKNHLLTTGYHFEGFFIEKYLGLVSGETVVGTGYFTDISASVSDLLGVDVPKYTEKIKLAKKSVLMDMITDSVALGGNAIIGISYEFMTFSGNMIGVSVNGTSVKIEPQKVEA